MRLSVVCLLCCLLSSTAYGDGVPARGFVPLRIKDYAADLFGPPNQVISAVKFVERLYGGDLSNLRQLYLRNVNNPSQKDWQGFNVSCEVLDISPSQGAKTITTGSRGDIDSNGSESLSASLSYFTSVDLTFKIYWTIDSYFKRAEGFNFTLFMQTTQNRNVVLNTTIDQNWHLTECIYPQAAPVVARLPLSSCQGYTVNIQVAGVRLAPFVVEKENLLMSAMFHPLNERLWIHRALVTNITQQMGDVDVISVVIHLVAANRIEEVMEAFTDMLACVSCKDGAARASFFQKFAEAGVNLTDAMLLSIQHQPGLTLVDQATAIGFPPSAGFPQDDYNAPMSAILGSCVAVVIVVTAIIGAILYLRQKRAKDAFPATGDDKSQDTECGLTGVKISAGSMMEPSSRRSLVSSVCSELDMKKWCLRNSLDGEDIEICFRSDGTPHELGRGGFCKVLKGLHGGVREVALKMLLDVEDPEKELARFTKELDLLRTLSFDSNIVQFYGASIMEGCPVLVLECMEGGDLSNAISNDRSGDLGWYSKGHKIALDVGRGLCFLHSCRCLHGDLTCRNILLNADYTVAKIGDLGLAKVMLATITDANAGGTLAFAAPELLLNMRCNEKADIFSLGVVLWNICTQEVPLRGHLRRLQVPEECPESIAELIDECLERPPEDRPSAKEAFEIIRNSMSPDLCRAACCRQRPPRTQAGSTPKRKDMARPPVAPSKERCSPLSQRWHSVSGCSLSRLAPRDLCPSANLAPPNPFHTDSANRDSAPHVKGTIG